ncbi:MAG: SpoIID/LytB domain-containing protein [Candidatus Calescibacterium sp.]
MGAFSHLNFSFVSIKCCLVWCIIILFLSLSPAFLLFNKTYAERSPYSVYVIYQKKKYKLDLEDYIRGVVAGEIPLSWPDDVLQAQAVVARSWTIYHLLKGKKEFYASQSDQVWLPEKNWLDFSDKVNKAVSQTRGWVLTFPSGEVAPGFFHSACGGKTENAYEMWNSEIDPKISRYIISVNCNKCYDSPKFFWRRKLKIKDVEKLLRKEDDPISERISSIFSKSPEYTSSGRIRKIFFYNGFFIGYNQIRELLGLPSNFFSFEIDGDFIMFFGRGFGHGVGMCQWGAKKLSEEGYSWKEILLFYFPLLKLKKIY